MNAIDQCWQTFIDADAEMKRIQDQLLKASPEFCEAERNRDAAWKACTECGKTDKLKENYD